MIDDATQGHDEAQQKQGGHFIIMQCPVILAGEETPTD
jgi:hypothetical protein